MELLTLYAGLLLPWAAGTAWLVAIDSRFYRDAAPNRFRQAGYGFFLGYAVLFLAVTASNHWLGTVSWPGIMGVLLLLLLGGMGVARLARNSGLPGKTTPVASSTPLVTILLSIAITLMAIHLVFVAVEIFTQPVYPWDAWLAWLYRAKAWSLAGGMVDIVSPAAWATATSPDIYTIDAWRYPLFPSVIPYWAALSLGHWSETLINVPVLFAGLALGMAVYGQCREFGVSISNSLIACYLLFSIPLIGSHIALAGYADIWMAAFCGLGFVALIRGVAQRGTNSCWTYHVTLGLALLLFSAWVKNEGVVWFLAALLTLVLAIGRPRTLALAALVVVIMVFLANLLGISHVDMPLLGQFGVVDGQLVIPLIGRFKLEAHNAWHAYWENFIKMGSWNLFWVAVTATLLLGLATLRSRPGSPAGRVCLVFILVFAATQISIFAFTDQGAWADTYTAINRLPLHFVPALLFAVVLIARVHVAADSQVHLLPARFVVPMTAAMLAAVIVTAGFAAYLSKGLPESSGQTHHHAASDLSFAFGSGFPTDGRMQVDGFANGYALLSSGPVSISAQSVRALGYNWLPPNPMLEAAFFWRRGDDAQNVQRTEITIPGNHLVDLAAEAEWRGEITEFGYLVAGSTGDTVEIGATALLPDNFGTRARLTWQAWSSFEAWSQRSINFLYGGEHRQIVSMPLMVITWFLMALVLLWLLSRSSRDLGQRQFFAIAGILFLLGWLVLDIRWSVNNVRQVQFSLQTYFQTDTGERSELQLDGEIYQYVQRLKTEVLRAEPSRILVLGDEGSQDYFLLRAKYHLLPNSVSTAHGFDPALALNSLEYIVFLGHLERITDLPGWKAAWLQSLVMISSSELGTVYRVVH